MPRLTETQINAILNPPEGLMVYCTDCSRKGLYVFDGTFFTNTTGAGVIGYETVIGSAGAIWLDRNLGASQVATSFNDANAYGYLYQWGRNNDGHQIRTSATSSGPVASGNEGSKFIVNSAGDDWLSVHDDTRWNGSYKGLHDPCPAGFRVPTRAEWDTEMKTWSPASSAGAFASPLKLTGAGGRTGTGPFGVGIAAHYSSSTAASGHQFFSVHIDDTFIVFNSPAPIFKSNSVAPKDVGLSVRCIKE